MDTIKEKLQRYKCHKMVHAAQIFAIMHGGDGWTLLVDDANGERLLIAVKKEWVERHNPQPGGYYVRYKDGYSSWSPADTFERGYSEVAVTVVE